MEEIVFYNGLYLEYKDLLSDKNKDIFDLYYGQNFSMQEIADIKKISKARVGKIIKDTSIKLKEYEDALHLYKIKMGISELLLLDDIDEIKEKLDKILGDE